MTCTQISVLRQNSERLFLAVSIILLIQIFVVIMNLCVDEAVCALFFL